MVYNRLQFISQGETSQAQLKSISRALDAGCGWIQLRYKHLKDMRANCLAYKVRRLCESYQAIFIVNDFAGLAKEVDADGVHLGLNDLSVVEARSLVGVEKIIGGTANTIGDVKNRMNEGCQYIGLGPFRFTTTKSNLSPILGIEGYRQIISELNGDHNKTPIFAIGGVGSGDLAAIRAAEVYGVAVSGLITSAENPKEMVKLIHEKLYEKI